MTTLFRGLLWLSSSACLFVAFGWPFVVEGSGEAFKVAGMGAFAAFYLSLVACIAGRLGAWD